MAQMKLFNDMGKMDIFSFVFFMNLLILSFLFLKKMIMRFKTDNILGEKYLILNILFYFLLLNPDILVTIGKNKDRPIVK